MLFWFCKYRDVLIIVLPWGWSDWAGRSRWGRVTSRVGRPSGRRDTAGTPSLFTFFTTFTSVWLKSLQCASWNERILEFVPGSELEQHIDRKCKVLANSLIDMQQSGLVGLYKYADCGKKWLGRRIFHAVNPRSHRFDRQPTEIILGKM